MSGTTTEEIQEQRLEIKLDTPVHYSTFIDAVGKYVGGKSQFGIQDTTNPSNYNYAGICGKCNHTHVYHYLTDFKFTDEKSLLVNGAVLVTKSAPPNIADLVKRELEVIRAERKF